MTPEQIDVIYQLRDEGHLVIIWTPEELGDVDPGVVEDIVIERGNNAIEWLKTEGAE